MGKQIIRLRCVYRRHMHVLSTAVNLDVSNIILYSITV